MKRITSHPLRALPFALLVAGCLLPLLSGCHNDTPASPNADTAAPARLPGEDPKQPPPQLRPQSPGAKGK